MCVCLDYSRKKKGLDAVWLFSYVAQLDKHPKKSW